MIINEVVLYIESLFNSSILFNYYISFNSLDDLFRIRYKISNLDI